MLLPYAAYDFRGVAWLGRDRHISTSVSPRSFARLRSAPPSAARKEYLGLGQKTPPSAGAEALVPAAADRDCTLPLTNWRSPISAKELARELDPPALRSGRRADRHGRRLQRHRTWGAHGPQRLSDHPFRDARSRHLTRAKCPSQPALLTSFGGSGSDGWCSQAIGRSRTSMMRPSGWSLGKDWALVELQQRPAGSRRGAYHLL